MFYAHFVLAKKGPLARIWLAAHWDKKLTKAHVFETNIESSVEGILQPKVKMALRTSGHLLLGIVRIYSRKAKYLLADCNEAFIKIKMAFRPGMVDLPEGNREAAVSTITLPEVFHDFDAAIPDIIVDMDAQVTLNQSRAEDITMKEDYATLTLIADDGFEDMGFDENDTGRDATNIEVGFDHTSLLLCEDQAKGNDMVQSSSTSVAKSSALDVPLKDDGFGGTVGEGLLDGETGGLFEPAGLFDDAPLDHVTLGNTSAELQDENSKELEKKPEEQENSDEDMYDMGPGSVPSVPSSPSSPTLHLNSGTDLNESRADITNVNMASSLDFVDTQIPSNSSKSGADIIPDVSQNLPPPSAASSELDQTTLINNEEETFALAPLDTTNSLGLERSIKGKRKRKLIVDEVKNISGEEMKAQLSDTADIVTTLDLAPPTKRLMHWKETGGVEKLFSLPGHTILSRSLSKAYQRHLTTRSVDNEEFGLEDEHIDLEDDMEQGREEEEIMVSRKRRKECDSVLPQDLSHLDDIHLDSSRPSYTTDHSLSHPSLDVPSFLQPPQHHMFPSMSTQQMADHSQPQMMSNVMSSVLSHQPPPAHMIHQMMQNDVNQLSHLSQMIHHQMADPTTHHSMTSNIRNIQSPIVSEAYNQPLHHSVMDSVSQHLISENISQISEHMHHHTIEKQMPNHSSFQNQLTQHIQQSHQALQEQISQPAINHMPCVENALHPCNDSHILQPSMGTRALHSAIDDEITQPLLDDHYTQHHAERKLNSLSSTVSLDMPLCDAPNPSAFDGQVSTHQVSQIEQAIPEKVISAEKDSNIMLNMQQPESNACSSGNNGEITVPEDQPNNMETAKPESNELPVSEDDEDYGAPTSVGPLCPEEQMADETYEQFEERILTKRTTQMLHSIQNSIENNKSVSFAELVRNNKRKQVAQKFYTFLVLKKQQAVELEQNSTFGDMIITKGPKFNAVYNAN